MFQQFKRILSSPVFIAPFAFAVRMAILMHWWHNAPNPVKTFYPYGFELGRVAKAIASGQGFSSPLRFVDTGPTVWFTPIFPYIVAGIFRIWGVFSDLSRIVIITMNSAFAALTVIPIYGIAERCFRKTVAVGAAWCWVFLPTAVMFPITWIWDTAMAALFLALIFWATLAIRDAKTSWAWAGYGASWAIGVLINPSLLSVFPFLFGWAVWESRRDSARWLKFSAATLLVFIIGLAPWTVRNYLVFGKFIALRSNLGLELWLGNNPNVADTWDQSLHPNDDRKEADKYKRMGEMPYMEEKQHEALAFMRTHPMDTLNHTWRRFVENWLAVTDSPADLWNGAPLYAKAFIIQNFLFSIFTMLGALFAYRSSRRNAFPLVMVILVFPLIFYVTHSSLRYRFPMDPIMMVLAAYGVYCPISLWRERFKAQREAPAAEPAIPAP